MSQVRKLYYEDVFRMQFCAHVCSCTPTGSDFAVTLDATAFYPEGGGQPADRGALGGARVLDVQEKDGQIVHIVTAPLRVGELVQGDVDRMRRIDHMQQHTGEHIVSGIVHSQYGYDNVGFHIGEEEVTVDFSGPLTWEELADVEQSANWIVWQNEDVSVEWPDAEALAAMTYRSKKALTGAVRIVRVGDADVCACCGTHVQRTGQIGLIKIVGAQSYKGGTRVTMLCGIRAFGDYCVKFNGAMKISAALSAKINELPAAVERLREENAALRAEKAAAEAKYFEAVAAQKKGAQGALVFSEGLAPASLRRLCLALCAACPGVCAAFSGAENGGYQYAVGGPDAAAFTKAMNAALGGRGGGRDVQQGSVTASRDAIEAYFRQQAV